MLRTPPSLCAALLLFSACGGTDEDAGGLPTAPGILRPQLRASAELRASTELQAGKGAAGEPAAEVVLQRYAVTAEGAPWELLEGTGTIRSARTGDGRHVQRILPAKGGQQRVLVIPGPFEAGSFDVVHVEYEASRNEQAFAMASFAYRGDGPEQRHMVSEYRGRLARGRAMTFELPAARGLTGSIAELRIDLPRGRAFGFDVAAVTLARRPLLGGWLPPAGEPPRLLPVAGLSRRAMTLASGEPVCVTIEAREGAQLHTSIGLPEACAAAKRGGTLVVKRGEDELARISIGARRSGGTPPVLRDLAPAPTPGAAWQDIQLDLGPLAGAELELELSLEAPGQDGGELAVLLEQPSVLQPAPRAPRVVLITSDTHRADHLGRSGSGSGVNTPFLDSLAERGALFLDCYASAHTTVPSHSTLMTGLTPVESGVLSNSHSLAEEARTLAEHFAGQGYRTYAAISVTHLAAEICGLGQGFDRVAAPTRLLRDSSETWDQLQGWLESTPEVPLFVWLHLFDAHAPYEPPEEFLSGQWDPERDPRDPDLPALPPRRRANWDHEIRDVEYVEALYRGEVGYVDERLREVLEHPRLAGSLVAITSDHGEVLRSREDREWFNHSELLDDTLRVPLVLHGPGVPAGMVTREGVRQLDVGRTLLDLAGLARIDFPGRNLLGGGTEEPRFGLGSHGRAASLRSGRWLAVLRLVAEGTGPGGTPIGPRDERGHTLALYDLEVDPGCLRNLEEAEPRVAGQLRARLVEWLLSDPQERLEAGSNQADGELAEKLEALGYADAGGPAGGSSALWDRACDCGPCREYASRPRAGTGPLPR